MKTSLFSVFSILMFSVLTFSCQAQEDKSTRPSPPAEAKGTIHGVNVTINYSTPAVKGRTIWGDLVPYGKVWRTGANEATIFETDKDLTINDKILPAGKYGLFSIPGEKEWTWIFNSVWDQWGAYKYDESKDVLRIQAVPQASSTFNERLKFEIAGDGVSLYWENLHVRF